MSSAGVCDFSKKEIRKSFDFFQEFVEKNKHIGDYIKNVLKLDVDDSDIRIIINIDHINTITGNFAGIKIRFLHPLTSLLNHNCAPNVKKYHGGVYTTNKVECRAKRDIPKGEELWINYIDVLIPAPERQRIMTEVSFADFHQPDRKYNLVFSIYLFNLLNIYYLMHIRRTV